MISNSSIISSTLERAGPNTELDDSIHHTCEYTEDQEVPFAPDGNSPLISDCVEKVKGVSGRFAGLRCVRKTLILPAEGDEAIRLHNKRRLFHEAKILYLARHQHVVQLIQTYYQDVGHDQRFAVIMERADSNLGRYLHAGSIGSTQWFSCLVSAVDHIHTLGIRHRDIKPSNILVKAGQILLADFGISQMGLGKTLPTTYQHRNSSRSREYCAPEVDQGSTRGRSADMFSLGAVFLEMLVVHCQPLLLPELYKILKSSRDSASSYAKHISQVQEWMAERLHLPGWQHELLEVCKAMLQPNRDSRPTSRDLQVRIGCLSGMEKNPGCDCAQDANNTLEEKLVQSCRTGTAEDVQRLLDQGGSPDTMGAVHAAAARGSIKIVKTLLQAGMHVDALNAVGQTALHCAARNGCEDVVRLLLGNKTNVNATDENDQTSLHGAAAHGFESVVQLLMEHNADPDIEDYDGRTAMQSANIRHHYAVMNLIANCKPYIHKLGCDTMTC